MNNIQACPHDVRLVAVSMWIEYHALQSLAKRMGHQGAYYKAVPREMMEEVGDKIKMYVGCCKCGNHVNHFVNPLAIALHESEVDVLLPSPHQIHQLVGERENLWVFLSCPSTKETVYDSSAALNVYIYQQQKKNVIWFQRKQSFESPQKN